MPRRIAQTGADKRGGIPLNLRIKYNGDAVLTGKNEMDNAAFDQFDRKGDLEEWTLDSPPEEVGYSVYAEGPGFPRSTRQAGPLPFEKPWHEQNDPLIDGPPAPDPTQRAAVAPFAYPPELELVDAGAVGRKAGWRGYTYAYGIGKPNGKNSLTNCAPLFTLYLDQGQMPVITLPDSTAEGVTFLAVGETRPFNTENQAKNATQVFIQETYRTKPRLPTIVKLKDKFKTGKKLSFFDNETFIGGTDRLGKTRIKSKQPAGKEKPERAMSAEVSYKLNTEHGSTDRQGHASIIINGEEVEFEPEYTSDEVKSWTPQIVGNTGNVQNLRNRPPGEKARASSTDASELSDSGETVTPDTSSGEDDSGIDGPDSALPDVVAGGNTLPPPGKYKYRLTKNTIDPDDDTEGESAPGPVATIDVPLGKFVRVKPPREYRNWIKNPEGLTRQTDTEEYPDGWERPIIDGVVPDDDPGRQKTVDTTGSLTDADVARTEPFDVSAKPTGTHRVHIELDNYDTGRVRYVMHEILQDDSIVETVLDSFASAGKHEVKLRLAQNAGGHVDHVWDPDVKDVQYILRHIGSTAAGPRDLTSILSDPIFNRGKAHPRKRGKNSPFPGGKNKKKRRVSLSLEDPPEPYPTFGYTVVVLDPPDEERPEWPGGDSAYIPGNYVEYYGPDGTPVTSTFFMGGHKMPVKPGEIRTVSLHFYWEGVGQEATPLKAVARSEGGVMLEDFGAFEGLVGVTEFSEDEADADVHGWVRRPITFTVPDGAAYVELIPGGCGDGLFRVMAGQNELGTDMTTWSNDHAPTGSLISTFDMGVPGVPRGALKTLDGIARFVRIGAEVTHDEASPGATSHIVDAQSKSYAALTWPDEWVEDPADLVLNEMVRVRTRLSTSDVDVTPEFHSHFIDFEREAELSPYMFGSLCRVDGTEFDGTVTLYDFPPVRAEKPILKEENADYSQSFAVMGEETKWARGFGIECYLLTTAEEIMQLVGEANEIEERDGEAEDASVFVGEIDGKRRRLRILEMEITPENREAHDPIEGMERDGRWNLQAEGLEGEVLGEEAF